MKDGRYGMVKKGLHRGGSDPDVLQLYVRLYLSSTSRPKKFEEITHVERRPFGSCDPLTH
jgi:hypothetical protein